MIKKVSRNDMREARHARVREKVVGTATEPRLNVFRSNSNIFAQISTDKRKLQVMNLKKILIEEKTGHF